ncbi:hypothetical protein TRVL_00826 [Trypanosoma vivax]|nr:hypothetical protein TRVL_00826 [Trypanosoma vivax]
MLTTLHWTKLWLLRRRGVSVHATFTANEDKTQHFHSSQKSSGTVRHQLFWFVGHDTILRELGKFLLGSPAMPPLVYPSLCYYELSSDNPNNDLRVCPWMVLYHHE